MTFCQQRAVLTTLFLELQPGEAYHERFPHELPIQNRQNSSGGSGGVIYSDSWCRKSPSSRTVFLRLFTSKMRELNKEPHSQGAPLARALYRVIEYSRLSSPFWEINHYLLFTGLEILARNYGPAQGPVAHAVSQVLTSHGFNVNRDLAQDFASARNAAFHQGLFESVRAGRTLNAIHQLFSLEMLLTDLCLKLLNFHDGHINWNRWRDRMPFGGE